MSPISMQKVESCVRLAMEYYNFINTYNANKISDLLSEACTLETANPAPIGVIIQGKKPIFNFFVDFFKKHQNYTIKIEETLGFGHYCTVRWISTWNDNNGIPISMSGADIFKEKDALFLEIRSYAKSTD